MKPIFTHLLFCLIGCWPVYCFGQADSIRLEMSQEKTPGDSVRQESSERATSEERALTRLFKQSRREVTLLELGIETPFGKGSGVYLIKDHRAAAERTDASGFWVGVEHKVTPAWALVGGVTWQFSPKTQFTNVTGTSWLGQAGLNYYPLQKSAIRRGKSANNFYNQVFAAARAYLPIHNLLSVSDANGERQITTNSFQRAVLLGFGIHSVRTRFYFYNVLIGPAYLFGRDEGLRHPIQMMCRISLGLGL